MNNVVLLGRITKEPEVKFTTNNVCVCSFTLAVNRNFKDSDGKYGTDFINCTSFSKTAEFISKYFTKGQQTAIRGRINTRNYTNKEDKKVYVTEVIAEEAYFADSKKEGAAEPFTNTVTDDGALPF